MLPMTPDMSVLDRMVLAVERVRDRLKRTVESLNAAGLPYAVIGGNAVAAWVATVDEGAVRNTNDVDILLRPSDLEGARLALEKIGFVYRRVSGIHMFLDGADATPRNAVHMIMANDKVRPEYASPAPDVTEIARLGEARVLALEALVRMKLTSFRDKDRTHIRDILGVGLLDETWLDRLPGPLAERLKQILDTPEG